MNYEAEVRGSALRISVVSADVTGVFARDQVIEAALRAVESELALPRSRVSVVYMAM